MRIKFLAILLALALGGCATSTAPPAQHSSAGNTAVAVIGTPFLWVFKAATCVVTVAVAAPAAGILALGVDPYGEGFDYLGSGVAHNCGPPWVLSPTAS
jgi:di/tricarboxylate transporter